MLKPYTLIMMLVGGCLLLFNQAVWAAKLSDKTCKSKWLLTAVSPTLSFGAFAIESGSGTLAMDSSATLTTTGVITAASTQVISNFVVTVDSGVDPACGTFPFDLSWGVAPAALAGAGTSMPLANVLVSEPTSIPTPTALPITGLTVANLPITLTFQGELTATFPQVAGTYTSPVFTLDLTQSGTTTPVSGTATVTALAPLSVAEGFAMDFGTVAGGSTSSTVVLDVNGNRMITGDGQILAAGPGAAASFNVSGEPNLSYAITYGAGVLSDGAGNTVTVDTFTDSKGGLGTLTAAGTDSFNVGATLNLAPLQPAGSYSTENGGTRFSVTVNYQ